LGSYPVEAEAMQFSSQWSSKLEWSIMKEWCVFHRPHTKEERKKERKKDEEKIDENLGKIP
jgi:hypothetical protein